MDTILDIVTVLILLATLTRLILWLGDYITFKSSKNLSYTVEALRELSPKEVHELWGKILKETFTPEELAQLRKDYGEEPDDGTN